MEQFVADLNLYTVAFLLIAGFVACFIDSTVGGGGLISAPALLALGTAVMSFPVEKDDTDLQLVLQNLEGSDLICTGVWGGRFDHLYSNVFSLLSYKEKHQAQVILADEKEAMLLVTAKEAVKICLHKKVKALSLLPLSDVNKVTLKNVRWELEAAELKLLHPYAISNIPQEEVTFECLEGRIGLYLCFEE